MSEPGLSPRVRGNPAATKSACERTRSIPACAGEPRKSARARPIPRVYPRVCGGTQHRRRRGHHIGGLSPRVRGNPAATKSACERTRSIPACAGEPRKSARARPIPRVYPRVCGGTSIVFSTRWPYHGLSPRVRGNPTPAPAWPPYRGSIPACAGNRQVSEPANAPKGSIPACAGEPAKTKPPYVLAVKEIPTLSPRVRGNPPFPRRRSRSARSIPACAGEPWAASSAPWPARVYPRVCGGTVKGPLARPFIRGLSPRVRGNLSIRSNAGRTRRSIPACAGEPLSNVAHRVAGGVYPRVCGGTEPGLQVLAQCLGLSPRVRGNPYRDGVSVAIRGSIPACAGEPDPAAGGLGQAMPVYPRVCGGTPYEVTEVDQVDGLSPRVRGNPKREAAQAPALGSIPACAGEPMPHCQKRRRGMVYPRVCGGTYVLLPRGPCRRGLSPRVRGNHKAVLREDV